jgi:hypothetical protein
MTHGVIEGVQTVHNAMEVALEGSDAMTNDESIVVLTDNENRLDGQLNP